MTTNTILIVILLCIGAIQGLVFGVMLIRSKNYNLLANRLLAIILFFLSYRLIVQTMRLFELGYYDGWYYFMLDMSWITGALLYFYVKAHTETVFQFKTKHLWHALPLAIQICFSIFVRLQNLYWDGTRESLSWLGYWGYVVWMNNPTIYIVASALIVIYSLFALKLLKTEHKQVEIDMKRLRSIRRIILSFLIYFSVVLIVMLADLLIFNFSTDDSYFYFIRFHYYPFFIGLSILTYWIGLEGFSHRNHQGIKLKTELSSDERQYLEDLADRLNQMVNEKQLYKEPELNLRIVAEYLDEKEYQITRCLKEILATKFTDYINEFRINELKQLLKNPDNDKFTLLSLAFEAGFNSKSSFNRAVKKQLNISPNELRSAI